MPLSVLVMSASSRHAFPSLPQVEVKKAEPKHASQQRGAQGGFQPYGGSESLAVEVGLIIVGPLAGLVFLLGGSPPLAESVPA